tara:strand:+ start:1393 stop:2703 length:1311 start_codon:yes stop_codon:yes gene_type:complete
MKKSFLLLLVLSTVINLSSCSENSHEAPTETTFQNEKTELIALGSYPDYYYNLAQELHYAERREEAIIAYQKCIVTSPSQTFVEDAMFNLSALYFENRQDSLAYALMDSLIARRYTWLEWYKQVDEQLLQSATYQVRLAQIDSLAQLSQDPKNCRFHYEDVAHFITAFKKSSQNWEQAPAYFYHDYFAPASKALYFYQKYKIQSSAHLFAYRVEDKQKYFQSILPNLQKLPEQETLIRSYLQQFEELYPAAIFPDIYYTVGCFNAGGTSSPFGLLIGAEMHSKALDSDLSNFNNWEQAVVRDFANLPLITLHELVHIQQNENFENLLGNAIYEGAADFISALVCGHHINEHVHTWANPREAEVWAAFKKEMYGEETYHWIGNAEEAQDQPADLGYYIGYKICEAFYQKQSDKAAAIQAILKIENWQEFYEQSGYGV